MHRRPTALLLARILVVASLLSIAIPATAQAPACGDPLLALDDRAQDSLEPGEVHWYEHTSSTGALDQGMVTFTLASTNGSARLHVYQPGACEKALVCDLGGDALMHPAGVQTCELPAGDYVLAVSPYLFLGEGPTTDLAEPGTIDYMLVAETVADQEVPEVEVDVHVEVEVSVEL